MQLETYLEKLRNCPDVRISIPASEGFQEVHALTAECGISDNWFVLFKCDFEQAVKYFKQLDECVFDEIRRDEDSKRTAVFHYKRKFCLKIYDHVRSFFSTGYGLGTEEQRMHSQRQLLNYDTVLLLHLNRGDMSNNLYLKEIADFVEKVAGYAKQFNIPSCFPRSAGYKHHDLSEIVYFP